MTFIMVSASSRAVIVAADGRGVFLDPQRRSPATSERLVKFHRIQDWPLVVGAYGSSEKFDDLVAWTQTLNPPGKWDVLKGNVNKKVNSLNKQVRDAMRSAGYEPGPGDQFLTAVVAGFVGNKPNVLHADDKGCARLLGTGTFPMGLLETIANATLLIGETLGANVDLNTLDGMEQFMRIFSETYLDVTKPIDRWEMKPDGSFTEALGPT